MIELAHIIEGSPGLPPATLEGDLARSPEQPSRRPGPKVLGLGLTEDNLLYYLATIDRIFGDDHPWPLWTRRWTAEECATGR